MRSKRVNWDALVPVGMNGRRTAGRIGIGLGASAAWGLCRFLGGYLSVRRDLVRAARAGISLPMPPFADLLSHTMLGFQILALYLVLLAAAGHYAYHYLETRSIYLMSRLPDKWDLWRRCLALPALGFCGCAVLIPVLLGVFFAVYQLCTPWDILFPH